jgi:hypothetical protein
MMRILAFAFLFISTQCFSQEFAFELWHDGKVITTAGDTLRGLIKYDFQQDLIQFNNKRGSVVALTARKVLFYEIFDNTVKEYRQFFSLPYSTLGGYRAPVFFELLIEGKMTLLLRESLEYRTYTSPYYMGSYTRLVIVNKFYMLDEKGNITEFIGKKSDLLNLMGRFSKNVDSYIKENKLKIEEKEDFLKIVEYYNSFF